MHAAQVLRREGQRRWRPRAGGNGNNSTGGKAARTGVRVSRDRVERYPQHTLACALTALPGQASPAPGGAGDANAGMQGASPRPGGERLADDDLRRDGVEPYT